MCRKSRLSVMEALSLRDDHASADPSQQVRLGSAAVKGEALAFGVKLSEQRGRFSATMRARSQLSIDELERDMDRLEVGLTGGNRTRVRLAEETLRGPGQVVRPRRPRRGEDLVCNWWLLPIGSRAPAPLFQRSDAPGSEPTRRDAPTFRFLLAAQATHPTYEVDHLMARVRDSTTSQAT